MEGMNHDGYPKGSRLVEKNREKQTPKKLRQNGLVQAPKNERGNHDRQRPSPISLEESQQNPAAYELLEKRGERTTDDHQAHGDFSMRVLRPNSWKDVFDAVDDG